MRCNGKLTSLKPGRNYLSDQVVLETGIRDVSIPHTGQKVAYLECSTLVTALVSYCTLHNKIDKFRHLSTCLISVDQGATAVMCEDTSFSVSTFQL